MILKAVTIAAFLCSVSLFAPPSDDTLPIEQALEPASLSEDLRCWMYLEDDYSTPQLKAFLAASEVPVVILSVVFEILADEYRHLKTLASGNYKEQLPRDEAADQRLRLLQWIKRVKWSEGKKLFYFQRIRANEPDAEIQAFLDEQLDGESSEGVDDEGPVFLKFPCSESLADRHSGDE